MAKKSSKKAGKTSSSRRIVHAKAGRKAAPKKSPSRAKPPAGPKAVSSGRGASPADIGRDLVAMFNAQVPEREIWDKHFSQALVSIEGNGMAWSGLKAVAAKGAEWLAQHTIHGASAEGPFVGATGFAVKFRMDVEVKATGQRIQMDEIGVYTVKNGKVVQEEFMYSMG
jgi:hypothetical protein